MTARDLLALLDRPCSIRHPDGTLTHGFLIDARVAYGELRCTVRVEGLTEYGTFRTWEQTYTGSRVWLLVGDRWMQADRIRGQVTP